MSLVPNTGSRTGRSLSEPCNLSRRNRCAVRLDRHGRNNDKLHIRGLTSLLCNSQPPLNPFNSKDILSSGKRRICMTPEQAAQLAELLRTHRQRLGLSAHEVARRAGVNVGTVTRIEKEQIPSPRPENLIAIGEVLGIPAADLFAVLTGYRNTSCRALDRTCEPSTRSFPRQPWVRWSGSLHAWPRNTAWRGRYPAKMSASRAKENKGKAKEGTLCTERTPSKKKRTAHPRNTVVRQRQRSRVCWRRSGHCCRLGGSCCLRHSAWRSCKPTACWS